MDSHTTPVALRSEKWMSAGTHPTEDVFVSCEMCLAFSTAVYSVTGAKVDIVGKTHGENGGG